MDQKKYPSISAAVSDLDSRGYTNHFEEEEYCLYCRDLRLRLSADSFTVDESHHIELSGEADGACMVYAVSSSQGLKGIVFNPGGDESSSCSILNTNK